jgi:hypothetical protein
VLKSEQEVDQWHHKSLHLTLSWFDLIERRLPIDWWAVALKCPVNCSTSRARSSTA